jgi:hypothetical protein
LFNSERFITTELSTTKSPKSQYNIPQLILVTIQTCSSKLLYCSNRHSSVTYRYSISSYLLQNAKESFSSFQSQIEFPPFNPEPNLLHHSQTENGKKSAFNTISMFSIMPMFTDQKHTHTYTHISIDKIFPLSNYCLMAKPEKWIESNGCATTRVVLICFCRFLSGFFFYILCFYLVNLFAALRIFRFDRRPPDLRHYHRRHHSVVVPLSS